MEGKPLWRALKRGKVHGPLSLDNSVLMGPLYYSLLFFVIWNFRRLHLQSTHLFSELMTGCLKVLWRMHKYRVIRNNELWKKLPQALQRGTISITAKQNKIKLIEWEKNMRTPFHCEAISPHIYWGASQVWGHFSSHLCPPWIGNPVRLAQNVKLVLPLCVHLLRNHADS